MNIRETLKQRAVDLGFDLVGIAPAVPGRDLEFAREWLGRGHGGEMVYLSNPRRFDPKLVLPSLQSVLCVGLIYDTPLPYSVEVGSRQKARGRKQAAEGGTTESEARSQKPESRERLSLALQPSPLGRGWSAEGGAGGGAAQQGRSQSFDSLVSNFRFPVSPAAAPRAWISRYAWGRDYHEIMREKLEKLRSAIEELAPRAETRVYVDTGPISERSFARFSGLGWMGKNTCIINEEKGSWFFLGVILTNLALEPDLPAPDHCGSCRACLDACPTSALVEPYVMDATRCISYLTIELKGPIPQDLRKGMGSNIFGCDICQDVCPWNSRRSSVVSRQLKDFEPMAFSRRPSTASSQQTAVGSWQSAIASSPIPNPKSKIEKSPCTQPPEPNTLSLFNPPLEVLAAMSEDDFREAFHHSPIRRAKYRGWLRNLSVAMGNSGDARFFPRLKELAASPDALIREHAEWALRRLATRTPPDVP